MYNEIQLTKNKMDLNIRKMTNYPPSPVSIYSKLQRIGSQKTYCYFPSLKFVSNCAQGANNLQLTLTLNRGWCCFWGTCNSFYLQQQSFILETTCWYARCEILFSLARTESWRQAGRVPGILYRTYFIACTREFNYSSKLNKRGWYKSRYLNLAELERFAMTGNWHIVF